MTHSIYPFTTADAEAEPRFALKHMAGDFYFNYCYVNEAAAKRVAQRLNDDRQQCPLCSGNYSRDPNHCLTSHKTLEEVEACYVTEAQ